MKPTELELLYKDVADVLLNEYLPEEAPRRRRYPLELEDRERLLRLSLSAAYALGRAHGALSKSDGLLVKVEEERT